MGQVTDGIVHKVVFWILKNAESFFSEHPKFTDFLINHGVLWEFVFDILIIFCLLLAFLFKFEGDAGNYLLPPLVFNIP